VNVISGWLFPRVVPKGTLTERVAQVLDKEGFAAIEGTEIQSAMVYRRKNPTSVAVWELGWRAATATDTRNDIDERLAEAIPMTFVEMLGAEETV